MKGSAQARLHFAPGFLPSSADHDQLIIMRQILFPLLFSLSLGSASSAEDWWRCFGEIKPGDFAGGGYESNENDPK